MFYVPGQPLPGFFVPAPTFVVPAGSVQTVSVSEQASERRDRTWGGSHAGAWRSSGPQLARSPHARTSSGRDWSTGKHIGAPGLAGALRLASAPRPRQVAPKVLDAGKQVGGKALDAGKWVGGKALGAGKQVAPKVLGAGKQVGGKALGASKWVGSKALGAGKQAGTAAWSLAKKPFLR